MFTHAEVWRGIDRLAKRNGLSPSALAKSAGLDATTFNPSKRITKERKSRWPSTESLAKILDATGTSLADFVNLMRDDAPAAAEAPRRHLPCLPINDLDRAGHFDETGFPTGDAWQEVDFPGPDDGHAYALEITGDAYLPVYRDGDILVLSATAGIRRHDRVLLARRPGGYLLGQLQRRTAQRIELTSFAGGASESVPLDAVAWMVRVTWASQ